MINFLEIGMKLLYNNISFVLTERYRKLMEKMVPYNKGGEFRKWYGNNEYS